MFRYAFDPSRSKFALTPSGRTGPLLSVKGNTVYKDSENDLLILLFVIGFAFPILISISLNNFEITLPAFINHILSALPFLSVLFYTYSATCWNIRRLHDINKNWSAILAPILFLAGIFVSATLGSILCAVITIVLDLSYKFPIAISGFAVSGCVYWWLVYLPHSQRWREKVVLARSYPAANQHGPLATS